ncbi:MAG: Ig-like domain-containing protein [Verrucomicrobiae bacterium]|nr:Ig-like domain-containing protein [Verrucomicrobiae bacterium]
MAINNCLYILIAISAVFVFIPFNLLGLSASDYAVLAWAEVSSNPPSITIKWNTDSRAINYTLYKKSLDEMRWANLANLAPDVVSFTDTNVATGQFYEYKIVREGVENTTQFRGISYIVSGIEVLPVESRGGVILFVENSLTSAISNEIFRLQLDLVGDGWSVIRHDIPQSMLPRDVKAVITNDYFNSSIPVKAVFLLGRIPVPYSGMIAPDGHSDHVGAWPADVYYGDIDGNWTDNSVNYTNSSNSRLTNIPGDGKFDQSQLPSDVELWVGRVDLSNMPAFGLSEVELIRKYLWKNHNYRFNYFRFQKKGVIDDNFGEFGSEAFAASAWRDFTAFFGRANVMSGDYFGTLTKGAYLWSYGCGAGSYTSASGVGNTDQFSTNAVYTVFTMLFGSYHGDWDSQNNFMRAALCYPSYGLTCAWSGRPHWHSHHVAMGFPIGYSAWISQNNSQSRYEDSSYYKRNIHIALMGDPTLRMHVVEPPSNFRVLKVNDNSVLLTWNPPNDAVAGYIVCGANELFGTYNRLHDGLITETNFLFNSSVYSYFMVRAVKLENSASGSYYNLSQGVFQSSPPGSPLKSMISISEPYTDSIYSAGSKIKISADVIDPARLISKVIFYNGEYKLGEATAPPYEITWQNVPAGTFTITAQGQQSDSNIARSSSVVITVYKLLIEKTSVWKYLDDGSDAGAAWRGFDFDDSNWKSGQAELGYSNAPVTVVDFGDDPSNKFITTYFRKFFIVDDVQSFTNLVLGIKRDDGAVVYINGCEVLRDNMPSGAVDYKTLASAAVSGSDESRFFVYNISPQFLQNGTNIIAVEVHQNSPSSSDLSFDLYLYAQAQNPLLRFSISKTEVDLIRIFYPNLSPLIKIQSIQSVSSGQWLPYQASVLQADGINTFYFFPFEEPCFFRLIIE